MLQFAKNVLGNQRHFEEVLSDVREEKIGTIRFGASAMRTNFALPIVLPIFAQKYPNVNIQVKDNTSANLQNLLLADELDVAICSLNEAISNLNTNLLLSDNIYFCVTDKLLKQYYPENYQTLKEKSVGGASLADFSELPFLTLDTPNKLGMTMAKCFEEGGFTPKSYLSATFTRTFPSLCSSSLAASVCTQMTINSSMSILSHDMNIFRLLYNNNFVYHNIYLTYPKGKYMTEYLKYFMKLIIDCFARVNKKDLTKLA